jgi:hypothetical protein
MNNTDSELRILELKKQLLEVELKKLNLERHINETNAVPNIDIAHVSNKVDSTSKQPTKLDGKVTHTTKSSTKSKDTPSYEGVMSLQEANNHLGLSKSSTTISKLIEKYGIKSCFRHGCKYLQISKRQLGEYYKATMIEGGKPPRVKRLPPSHYSLKEICSWMNVKPSHASVAKFLGVEAKSAKRVWYRGETYFYLSDKAEYMDKFHATQKEREERISAQALQNFFKDINEIKGDRLTLTEIVNIISDDLGYQCGRSYVEKVVNFMDLGDKIVPHYHSNSNKVKLFFYDISKEFLLQKHKEYSSHLYGDMFDNPTNVSQSEIQFQDPTNESIFSETYPWIVYGEPINIVLPKNSLDNIEDLDHNCTITFTKDNNALSVKVSSLNQSCQQAVFNYINHQ